MSLSNGCNYAIMIPARYKSSRFPGKPLADILGKPMIQHVWERCCLVDGEDKVYIATDDIKIQEVCKRFGANVIMTSSDCLTGTDRLAEAQKKINCNYVINVQGDEPLINPEDIKKVILEFFKNPKNIVNAMCPISTEEEFRSLTIPKVVCSNSNRLMYMSRAGVPLSKSGKFSDARKQVCIYAFSKDHLDFFSSFEKKEPLENIEDIEILRFIENDIHVQMIEVSETSLAVDTPQDMNKVIDLIKCRKKRMEMT